MESKTPLEEAAEKYAMNNSMDFNDPNRLKISSDFKAGVSWRDENPKTGQQANNTEQAISKSVALNFFEDNKQTFTGINAGQYLDKEDFYKFVNLLSESAPLPVQGEEPYKSFVIDAHLSEKVNKWKEAIKKKHGIYGLYEYKFVPNGIGPSITIKSLLTKEIIDLSEVEKW